jgi:citrate synthase
MATTKTTIDAPNRSPSAEHPTDPRAPARTDGLAGVWVADTRLSEVDGQAGRLLVTGEDIETLAQTASFEEVVLRLLVEGQAAGVPAEGGLGAVRTTERTLGAERVTAFGRLGEPAIHQALGLVDGMEALRAAVAQLSFGGESAAPRSAFDESLAVIAHVGVFLSAWARRREGLAPLAPDPLAAHGADLLRLLTGRADPDRARALTSYLVTVAEHGLNASTFTARFVASTGSDLVSAVVAGIGALKGPLHGGAPGPVLTMLDAIGDPAHAEAFLLGEIRERRRIMGMGHRIYRVRDPRAAVLEGALQRLEVAGVTSDRLRLARAVERSATEVLARRYPDRSLAANVEFYTAVLLDAVGLPAEVFSPLFAAARVAGFSAHVAEQRFCAKLMRPESRYVGARPLERGALPSTPTEPATTGATAVR